MNTPNLVLCHYLSLVPKRRFSQLNIERPMLRFCISLNWNVAIIGAMPKGYSIISLGVTCYKDG